MRRCASLAARAQVAPPAAVIALEKAAAPSLSPGAKFGFVIVGSLFVTYFFVTHDEKSPRAPLATPSDPVVEPTPVAAVTADATVAWVMSKQFVKQQLKSPGSADFGSPFSGDFQQPAERCKVLEDGAWKCSGWVDAQNELSAKIRADFVVTIKPTPDGSSWRAIEGPTLSQR